MPPVRRKRMTRAEMLLRFAGSTFMALAFLLLAGVSAMGAWHMYGKFAQAGTDERAAQNQLALLTAQKERVEADVSELQSPRGIEAVLRERYGVARPGEGVIQVVEPRDTGSSSEATSTPGFFSRLFQALAPW